MLRVLGRWRRRLACLFGLHHPLAHPELVPFTMRVTDDDDVPLVDIRCCARCGVVYWAQTSNLEDEMLWRSALWRA